MRTLVAVQPLPGSLVKGQGAREPGGQLPRAGPAARLQAFFLETGFRRLCRFLLPPPHLPAAHLGEANATGAAQSTRGRPRTAPPRDASVAGSLPARPRLQEPGGPSEVSTARWSRGLLVANMEVLLNCSGDEDYDPGRGPGHDPRS